MLIVSVDLDANHRISSRSSVNVTYTFRFDTFFKQMFAMGKIILPELEKEQKRVYQYLDSFYIKNLGFENVFIEDSQNNKIPNEKNLSA